MIGIAGAHRLGQGNKGCPVVDRRGRPQQIGGQREDIADKDVDAVCLVVSEERGTVSLVQGGVVMPVDR